MADATATTAPATETKKPKRAKRPKLPDNHPTAEAAINAANTNPYGPKRAFKCTTADGKTFYTLGNNEGRGGGVAFGLAGGTVEEIGKAPRAKKLTGPDAIMSAMMALPEAERAQVFAQIEAAQKAAAAGKHHGKK